MGKRKRRGRSWTPESGRRGATARWARAHAEQAGEPVRETRVVEFPVIDTHRPRTHIRLESNLTREGSAWGRWRVWENGERVGKRRLGRTAVGKMIAKWLE